MAASKRSMNLKDYEIIYDRICAVLTDTNESTKEIAIRTGLHQTTISNIFNKKAIGYKAILKISDTYFVSLDFLAGKSNDVGNYHINNPERFAKMIHTDHIDNPREITIKIVPGEDVSDYMIELICGVNSDDDYVTKNKKVNNRMQGYMFRMMEMYKHTK